MRCCGKRDRKYSKKKLLKQTNIDLVWLTAFQIYRIYWDAGVFIENNIKSIFHSLHHILTFT